MNKLTIIGNLTRDPEQRNLSGGFTVTTFSVAVNKKSKDDRKRSRVFQSDCLAAAWRTASNTSKKGRKVAVIGSVSLNTYTGNDGQNKASLEVNADEVEFLSPADSAQVDDRDERGGFVKVEEKTAFLICSGHQCPYLNRVCLFPVKNRLIRLSSSSRLSLSCHSGTM